MTKHHNQNFMHQQKICIACKEKQVKKRKDMEQNDNLSKMLFLKFAKYFLHAKTFKDALQSW